MTTYLITSIDVQTYNRDIKLHVDLDKESRDKCPRGFLQVDKPTAPFQRTAVDKRKDWLMEAEDYWLNLINAWYYYEFNEPFVFIKLNKRRLNDE